MKSNLPHVNPASCINAACMECGETLPQKSQVLGTASSVWMAGARHLPVLGGGVMYLYVNEHMRGHMCGGQGTNLLFFLRGIPL